uniref:Urease subunit alpha n=1 Tax=Anthurium amnicola TaxID=1678845 RepID=A0A1D1XES8_9ARAE
MIVPGKSLSCLSPSSMLPHHHALKAVCKVTIDREHACSPAGGVGRLWSRGLSIRHNLRFQFFCIQTSVGVLTHELSVCPVKKSVSKFLVFPHILQLFVEIEVKLFLVGGKITGAAGQVMLHGMGQVDRTVRQRDWQE